MKMMMDRPEKFEIEEALNILVKSEEIKKNKDLLDEVIKYAEKKKTAISSIADLKAKYNELVSKEDSEEESGEESDGEEDGEEEAKSKEKTSQEKVDPLLEENTYIRRVERANEEANAPSEIPLVKVVED